MRRNDAAHGLSGLIDLDRYPLHLPASPALGEVVDASRAAFRRHGVVILPGFVLDSALRSLREEIERLAGSAHYEDVSVGTPYLELPDESWPDGHPRRTNIRSATTVIAYDQIPPDSLARRLYQDDGVKDFIGAVLDRRPLYRFADPLGALNLTAMREGDVQGWHYDSTDFVVSLSIQASQSGGRFECVPQIRSDGDENYAAVAEVLRGGSTRVISHPMTPGTLMIFAGRHSIHRVSPVTGVVPRYVGLFAYDTRPGTNSSDLLKMVRYGRVKPIDA